MLALFKSGLHYQHKGHIFEAETPMTIDGTLADRSTTPASQDKILRLWHWSLAVSYLR